MEHDEAQDSLDVTLGRIARLDAAVDEWLMQLLYALCQPADSPVVRILTRRDSSATKADSIRSLFSERNLDLDTSFGSNSGSEPTPTPKQVLARVQQLKSRRDAALHSFYAARPADAANDEPKHDFWRYRSRSPEPLLVSSDELSDLLVEYSTLLTQLSDLTIGVEEVLSEMVWQNQRANELRREVVSAALRLRAERCRELGCAEVKHSNFTFDELGRPRPGGSIEELQDGEAFVESTPTTGGYRVTTAAGETVEGGDTGWRDVTSIAQTDDPTVEAALIRRVDSTVQLRLRGSQPMQLGEPASLEWRIFGRPGDPPVPEWVYTIQGFAPA